MWVLHSSSPHAYGRWARYTHQDGERQCPELQQSRLGATAPTKQVTWQEQNCNLRAKKMTKGMNKQECMKRTSKRCTDLDVNFQSDIACKKNHGSREKHTWEWNSALVQEEMVDNFDIIDWQNTYRYSLGGEGDVPIHSCVTCTETQLNACRGSPSLCCMCHCPQEGTAWQDLGYALCR